MSSIGNISRNSQTDFSTKGIRSVLENSRLSSDENFQNEWNKAELNFTNAIDGENETVK